MKHNFQTLELEVVCNSQLWSYLTCAFCCMFPATLTSG